MRLREQHLRAGLVEPVAGEGDRAVGQSRVRQVQVMAVGEVGRDGDTEQSALVARFVHARGDVDERGRGQAGVRVVHAHGAGLLGDEQPVRAVSGGGESGGPRGPPPRRQARCPPGRLTGLRRGAGPRRKAGPRWRVTRRGRSAGGPARSALYSGVVTCRLQTHGRLHGDGVHGRAVRTRRRVPGGGPLFRSDVTAAGQWEAPTCGWCAGTSGRERVPPEGAASDGTHL